ncbi:hypothetical protein [Aquimarina sp. 2201CG14-23]|nr:hypothetical protein [Aquimarina sp. 2201CG14-23]MDH7446766.1 hypothetical protein [Aquimarina sp. 2201CG14-23]
MNSLQNLEVIRVYQVLKKSKENHSVSQLQRWSIGNVVVITTHVVVLNL